MARSAFLIWILLIVLALSQLLLSLHAVPVSRIDRLGRGRGAHQALPSSDNTRLHLSSSRESFGEAADQDIISTRGRRMDVEMNDYPGSGANNRHTPRPPP